jgi:hypothetical protein
LAITDLAAVELAIQADLAKGAAKLADLFEKLENGSAALL